MSAPKKRPWTLRDIRRVLGRAYDPDVLTSTVLAFSRRDEEAWRVFMGWIESTLPREEWPNWVGQAIRHFDRLIALYGPDATEPPKKEEEKATAANRPGQPGSPEPGDRAAEGETDASGEGPARQDGNSEPREGSSPPSLGATEAADPGSAEPEAFLRGEPNGGSPPLTGGSGANPGGAPEPVDRDDPHPGGAEGAQAVEEDGAVAKAGSSGPGREGPDGDAEAPSPSPTRPGADDAEANDVSDVNPDDAAAMDAHGTSAPPSPVRSGQWGGQYVDLDYRLPPHDRKGAKEIIRLLRRVIAAAEPGLGIEQSPRIAGRKLVRELASRRANITRARRDELDIPIVLILADVSGSCSAVSSETFAAAVELSRLDERVVAIEHSNGVPIAVYAHGRVERFVDHYEAVAWWKEYILRHRIGAVVAFGDEDAFEIFRILSRTAPLVWLDSYTARLGVVRDQTARMRERIPVAAYMVGVNSAATAAIALRMAERRLRRR